MTRNTLIILAVVGSGALLLGALGFQHFGGLDPCKLCIWQRWPHGGAIAFGILALMLGGRIWIIGGALGAAATAGVGVYHTGVERNWWKGPTTCTSGPVDGVSTDDLLDQILTAPLIRCDEVAWDMLGLSMASWNAILSAGFVVLWLMALKR